MQKLCVSSFDKHKSPMDCRQWTRRLIRPWTDKDKFKGNGTELVKFELHHQRQQKAWFGSSARARGSTSAAATGAPKNWGIDGCDTGI